jgi:hypothetical protein
MDKCRRRVTLGLLSAPLATTLAGCNSSNDSEGITADFSATLTDRLTAELKDENTARQLCPFIEEANFNMSRHQHPDRLGFWQAPQRLR